MECCTNWNHSDLGVTSDIMSEEILDFPPIRESASRIAENAVNSVLEGQRYAHARVRKNTAYDCF